MLRLRDECAGGQVGQDVVPQRGQVVEVEILQCLDLRKWAVRIRITVPLDSRSATWRCSSAAKYSSWDQFSSRAWSASSSQNAPIVGAFSTRVR